jgi:cytochrome c biogenesis protein CcdA
MQLFVFVLLTGLLDALNPSTIVTQLILLIKTKSQRVSVTFIVATVFTYLSAGLLLYYGLANTLVEWTSQIKISHGIWLVATEIIIVLVSARGLYYMIRAKKKGRSTRTISSLLTPAAVLLLGLSSTLSDLPTAFPYFAFIAKMETTSFKPVVTVLYFIFYNFIYILPLLVIHCLFVFNTEMVTKAANKIEMWIDRIGKWILILLLICVIVFLVTDIVRYFLSMRSLFET